jgi:hypothetical protein
MRHYMNVCSSIRHSLFRPAIALVTPTLGLGEAIERLRDPAGSLSPRPFRHRSA